MEIKGQIEEIIYKNEINSYTIAILDMEEEIVTVVGYLPFINCGDTVKLSGKYVTHQEYGRQFKIDTFEKLMPETIDALERYLSNGTIKGIGPAIARRIVQKFGEDTINIFKFEPEKLADVKGISKDKAIEIGHDFTENWELWQIVGFLEKFGIGVSSAKTIYKQLGTGTIEEIEANPYILIDLARGVDFKRIDKMALDLGIEYNNYKRIKSGIKYSLIKASLNGHTCVLEENLIQFVKDLLGGVDTEDIDNAIIDLKVKEEIVIEERAEEEQKWIYLYPFYKAEINICERLIVLDNAKNIKKISFFEKELNNIEKMSNIKLSSKQKEALEAVNKHNVTVITGGPGTGKTTIIRSLIKLYKTHGKKVVLCAPTGRAAKRITETTGEEAKTLHRLLEIGKIEEEGKIASIDYDVAPLDADVIVVDEISMVDVFLMNYLMKAIYLGTKVVLVGDVDQLPSVGPGSILKDIINSEKIETIHLDKIFRQAAKSKIIVNAHRVNEGEKFLNKKEIEENNIKDLRDDFFYINEGKQEKILEQVISLSKDRLKNYGNYDFFNNIQVLTPTKKGMLGTKELNKVLQNTLNPSKEGEKEKIYSGTIFRKGDRIMQIKNNYDIYWEKEDDYGSGVFNGELGTILKIDEEEKQIQVKYDDEKIVWYPYSDLDQIEHAYAITIHKAQGSEFDVVIIVVAQSSPILLTRNLLYTGITRAKDLLIVIGADNVIEYMIKNIDSKKRNTGLEYKLRNI